MTLMEMRPLARALAELFRSFAVHRTPAIDWINRRVYTSGIPQSIDGAMTYASTSTDRPV